MDEWIKRVTNAPTNADDDKFSIVSDDNVSIWSDDEIINQSDPEEETHKSEPDKPEDEVHLDISASIINLKFMPEPILDEDEEKLPDCEKELRVIIKKCEMTRRFNFFGLSFLLKYVTPPALDLSGKERRVLKVETIEMCPYDFHLAWESEGDKRVLLNRWLTAEVNEGRLTKLDKSLVGKREKVVAIITDFTLNTDVWARAVVKSVLNENGEFLLYFPDYGKTEYYSSEDLRALPPELGSLPPLIFHCQLDGVIFDEDVIDDEDEVEIFKTKLRAFRPSSVLLSQIRGYEPNRKLYLVSLRIANKLTLETEFDFCKTMSLSLERKRNKCKVSEEEIKDMMKKTLLISPRDFIIDTRYNYVRDFVKFEVKGHRKFKIIQVETPHKFRAEYVINNYGQNLGLDWNEVMQGYYNVNHEAFRLSTAEPNVGGSYVFKNESNGKWERVKIVQNNDKKNSSHLYALDTAIDYENVSYRDIFELHNKFSHCFALGFVCFLTDVTPLEKDWSQKSIEVFRKMTVGKTFSGVILALEVGETPDIRFIRFPQLTMRLGLVLYEDNFGPNNEGYLTLNADLCRQKLAHSTGITSASVSDFLGKDDVPFDFDLMTTALISHGFGHEIESVSCVMGKDVRDLENVELPGYGKIERKLTPRLKVDPILSKYKTMYSKVVEIPRDIDQLPSEISTRLVGAILTHLISPSCFYIQLVKKVPYLGPLSSYLKILVENEKEIPLKSYEEGLPVAVMLHNSKNKPSWYRAVIKTFTPNIQLAKVVLVDYGSELSIKFAYVRRLPPLFCDFSGLAIRVHLDVANVAPIGNCIGWPNGARNLFSKYLHAWQSANPLYYIYQHKDSQIIKIDEIGQELKYDFNTKRWVKRMDIPNKFKCYVEPKPHQFSHDSPLLKNLLQSRGIDMIYEDGSYESRKYNLEKCWDILHTQGFIQIN